MTREEGLKQIDEAQWIKDPQFSLLDLRVKDKDGEEVHVWLTPRPVYCDRGHLQVNIEGPYTMGLDAQDSFPRFFFSFEEADRHMRLFLKWRIWKERECSFESIQNAFRLKNGPTGQAGPWAKA